MLRFAPSPTGDMHIGNLRAAIFNYIVAKQRGEKFLIRIEDTDSARNIKGADKEILAILNLFGLFWDKLVYQSENFPLHRKLAQNLVEKNKAFYCYATKDFLEQKRAEASAQKRAFRYKDEWAEICKSENGKPAIRLKGIAESSKNISALRDSANFAQSISFFDAIKGECKFSANEIDSFVILREDTIPTYNFACAVDDMLYDISFIIRGEDHTSNTPKQMLIHRALGYDRHIEYAHLPIILNDEGKKMSKRESESSVKWLLSQGFLPRAIVNYLLLMGNNPPCEIFSLDEAIAWFDLSQLSKSPVRFDINQLRHINREHLKRLSESEMGLLLVESNEKLRQVVGNSPLGLQFRTKSAESSLDSAISQSGLPREQSSLAMTENKAFAESALDSANQAKIAESKFTKSLGAIGKIFLEEASTLNELNDKLNHIFAPKDLKNFEFGENARILRSEILRLLAESSAESSTKSNAESNAESSAQSCPLNDFESLKSALSKNAPFKGKVFFMPLRFLLTGAQKGPHLDTLYPHLRPFLAQILKD